LVLIGEIATFWGGISKGLNSFNPSSNFSTEDEFVNQGRWCLFRVMLIAFCGLSLCRACCVMRPFVDFGPVS
jgi:hypothetical protein